MYKFEIQGSFSLSIDASKPDQRGMLIYSDNAPKDFIQWLKFESGQFGHEIGDRASFLDVHFALKQSQKYSFEVLEGKEDIGIPESIPEDAKS